MSLAKSAKFFAKRLRAFRRLLGALRVLGEKNGPVRPKNGVWKAFLDFFALKWANNGCYYGFGGMSGTKMRVGDSGDRM